MKKLNKQTFKILIYFIPFFTAITLISGLIYSTGQQILRIGANDPQIQISEDYAQRLSDGVDPKLLKSGQKTDISKSLAPYVIIYDSKGNAIFSSALLNGKIPTPPKSVFNYVEKNNETRITWQPEENVRSAIVITKYQGENLGYVLAGRSLREVEIREDNLLRIVFAGWFITEVAVFISFLFTLKIISKI